MVIDPCVGPFVESNICAPALAVSVKTTATT
jgi:hypothetical protein